MTTQDVHRRSSWCDPREIVGGIYISLLFQFQVAVPLEFLGWWSEWNLRNQRDAFEFFLSRSPDPCRFRFSGCIVERCPFDWTREVAKNRELCFSTNDKGEHRKEIQNRKCTRRSKVRSRSSLSADTESRRDLKIIFYLHIFGIFRSNFERGAAEKFAVSNNEYIRLPIFRYVSLGSSSYFFSAVLNFCRRQN